MKLLVDLDVLVYRAGFATDKTSYLLRMNGDGFCYGPFDNAKAAKEAKTKAGESNSIIWSRKETEPEDKALMLVDIMIGEICARFASENLEFYGVISGVGNHRYSVATRAEYKGNRSQPKPAHYKAIRQHLIDQRGAAVSSGEEADDVIARAAKEFPGSVVVSVDKDLMQIPGRHYNFVTREETKVSVKDSVLNFYSQCISGDCVDNIPGLSGYGPVKARQSLVDCKGHVQCWKKVVDLYCVEFGPEVGPVYALECARLVKIGMPKGELWSPPDASSTANLKKAAA